MSLTRSIALACLACLAVSPGAQAQEAKPPRNAVALTSDSTPENGTQISFASATLRKGKKGRILRVDLRVAFDDALDFTINGSASVRVNGVVLELSHGGEFGSCGPASSCTVEAYGWLDLDAAEAASPGTFVGQPLEIEVRGNVNAQSFAMVNVSLLAQLLRK